MELIEEISPNDRMASPDYPEAYFLAGKSAVRCIRLAMDAIGMEVARDILDFPCGHGRVLRGLKAMFPDAKLTASDIDKDGVDFCARTFGAEGVYSDDDLSVVPLGQAYDLIWVGSLFTHLPAHRWTQFLDFLHGRLAPGGLLVFTTHGAWYADQIRAEKSPFAGANVPQESLDAMLRDYEINGFGFAQHSNRVVAYGLSLSSPSAVTKYLEGFPQMRLVSYLERGWRGHQDVVACQRGFTTPDL
jgi:SAM-dependent methyltransferase